MDMDKYLEEVNQAPVLALTLVIAAGIGFSAGNLGDSGDSADSGLAWEGEYTIEKNGEVIDVEHNTLTKQGQNYIAGKLFNTSDAVEGNVPTTSNKFAWIGVGNGTKPDYSYDSLNQEIDLSVDEGNISRGLADTYKFEEATSGSNATYIIKKEYNPNFPSENGPITVNTTGLHFNASGPSMISGGNFSGAELKDGDKLSITHEITLSG